LGDPVGRGSEPKLESFDPIVLNPQRRRWDSNPRYRKTVHRFSRPALSTTQAPLPISWRRLIERAGRWLRTRLRSQFTKLPPGLEEFCEDFAALRGEDARGDLGPVVEPRVGD